ncbi:flavin reductase family protein [Sagittula sp. NFXS13]|uniref:flavin reductase family protein n=1 Tax=Sagittula sp. NFXS13 TaxID=2819095 RepID=UPI0032DF0D35
MRLVLTPGVLPRLERAHDFKAFSVAVPTATEDRLDALVAPVGELAEDRRHVWVRPDAVRALTLLSGDGSWAEKFDEMMTYAARNGWTDETGRFRAHIDEVQIPASVDAASFRDAMRRFASGVCVVAAGEGATRCGMTVSAVSSVSAEPPMVLVCLNRASGSHDCVTGAGTFSINILSSEQEEEAMLFAGQRDRHGADRFDDLWTQDVLGAPVLTTAHHALICTSDSQHVSGSHTILVGRVVGAHSGETEGALLNYNGELRRGTWAA